VLLVVDIYHINLKSEQPYNHKIKL
jgi:hypothetical protein